MNALASNRRRLIVRPWLLLGLVLMLALIAAGCGGGDSGSTNALAGLTDDGTPPAAAELLPADVPVLVTFNTDLDSDQWQLASDIVDRFPASQDLIDMALKDLAGEGLDFETDVRPALGPDVTVALLDVSTDDPPVAVITEPIDADAFEALLERGRAEDAESAPAERVVGDAYILADDEATLDRLLAAADAAPLSDDPQFKSVMESLPTDSLARLWISPAVVGELGAVAAAGNQAGADIIGSALGTSETTFEGAGAALIAAEEGVRLVGVSKTMNAPITGSGAAEILDLAPSGVLAYVSLRDLRTSVGQLIDIVLEQEPDAQTGLAQAEALLGLTIEGDLLPLFENEHAVYVRSGVPIPEVTIVLSPDDPEAGVELVKQLTAAAGIGGLAVERDTIDVGGTEAERLAFSGFALYVASVEGRLLLTTAEAGITDFGGPDTLRADQRFADVSDAVGLPDETAGFVYVDVAGVVELVTLGGLLGALGDNNVDPEDLANVDPLGALLLYGSSSADEQQFAGILTIE